MVRMKRVLCLVLPMVAALVGNAQWSRPDHLAIEEAERAAAARWMAVTASPETGAYDLRYHRLEWTVDPAQNYISGAVTSYFSPLVAGFDTIYFDLSDSLTVDSVHWHGQAVAFAQPGGELLRIALPVTVPDGGLDSVTVWYQGAPFGTGFGSFIQSMHDSVPVLWTLSEPYGAKDWWPCKNGITDKIDSIDMLVVAPAGNLVAGNGVLVETAPVPGGNRHHWRHRHPIATYLIAFAVTNYAQYSEFVPWGGDTLEILNYVFPEDSAGFATYSGGLVAVMQLYDSLFGMYPYQDEKYGHAQFGWGGGMEHQTMSFVVNSDHELLAHELAHQWFGDRVTCGSWQDIWLNEGWATYCAGLTYEHGLGGWQWQDFKRARIDFVTSVPGGSVWVDDTTQLGRIFDGRLSYSKGAMVLHQLRWVVGDSAFFAAARNYLEAPGLSFAFARTEDFRQEMEASSGMSLQGYFDDWIYGEGFPNYEVHWALAGDTARFEILQTVSMPGSVPFFRLPVPLRITDGIRDTTFVFDHTFSGQLFTVRVPFVFDSVHIDPEYWLIKGPSTVVAVAEEAGDALAVDVFPNPASDFVNIRGHQLRVAELWDAQGKVLGRFPLRGDLGLQRLELGPLPGGLYLLHVQDRSGRATARRIVVAE